MISPARQAALKALLRYRQSSTLEQIVCERQDDARLAEHIVYGVLQNERFLDHCLSAYLPNSLARVHPKLLDILRLSAFQILFLDRVPASAAVNQGVQMCRNAKMAYASGMVNAVLRRISENRDQMLSQNLDAGLRYSHPGWLTECLLRDYDESFVRAFCMSNQSLPALRLQVNTDKTDLDSFLRMLKDSSIEIIAVNRDFSSVLIPSAKVESIPGYSQGLFYVQDDAARAPVRAAGIKQGQTVLDACAAPGGKSMAAALDGGVVTACDVNGKRLQSCRENFERLQMTIPVRQLDASVSVPAYVGAFDVVIADVPCSGTGVIHKHPEIRCRTRQEVEQLLPVQAQILDSVSEYVRPGGVLIYSTCSVLREEDEAQVESFLRKHNDYLLDPICMDGFQCESGMLRSWPQLNHNDGFFAARMRRLS